MICIECGIAILTSDADSLVKTDAGPVHRECFQGPLPPGQEPELTDDDLRRSEALAELFGW